MNKQTSDVINGLFAKGASRRDLMRLTGAAAGAIGLGRMLGHEAAAEPELMLQGDASELVIGVQAVPEQLDPPQNISNVGGRVLYTMFDHPIRTDFTHGDPPGTGQNLIPMLAEKWTRVDDLTLELNLRKGVLFHNGDPMTAEDVKFSLDRLLGDKVAEELSNANLMVSTFAQIDVVDDLTLRIKTAKPDPVLEIRLSSTPCYILPKAYFEKVGVDGFAQKPIGTGPYKFVELRPDDALVLEAFEDYWGGKPPVSRVTFRVIPETATRVTALAGNEVQIIVNVPPDQVPTLESTEGVKIAQVPRANFNVLTYNTKNPVLKDKRIRQALNLGIDRQLLVDALWGGMAFVTQGLQVDNWGKDYINPDRPKTPYDPDKAKQLLKDAGYNGEKILYTTPTNYYTLGAETGQAVVSMWQDLGINAEFENREDAFAAPLEEIMVRAWSNGTFPFDPDGCFWRIWGEGSSPQQTLWTPENPRFNELGNAARQTLDKKFRYDAYQEMLDIFEDEAPGTSLYNPIELYPMRDTIDWTPSAYWYMDFRPDNLKMTGGQ